MKKIKVEFKSYFNGDYQCSNFHSVTTLAGLERLVRKHNDGDNGWGWIPALAKSEAIALGAYETNSGTWAIQYPNSPSPSDIEVVE